ncbi:MAG: hypothetical protein CMM44_10195 [Rhodospirillaceae bacterium]|nr:hypothetical protein [Rhodospirillaceae bacterium]
MSLYELQKLVCDVNRDPVSREAFFKDDEGFSLNYALSANERRAVLERNYGQLYAAGVHGLILRPFSLLHKVSETEYLDALRKACSLRADPQTGELI